VPEQRRFFSWTISKYKNNVPHARKGTCGGIYFLPLFQAQHSTDGWLQGAPCRRPWTSQHLRHRDALQGLTATRQASIRTTSRMREKVNDITVLPLSHVQHSTYGWLQGALCRRPWTSQDLCHRDSLQLSTATRQESNINNLPYAWRTELNGISFLPVSSVISISLRFRTGDCGWKVLSLKRQ